MKKTAFYSIFCGFLFAFLMAAPSTCAQNTAGEITYVETIKLRIELPEGPEAEAMRKMLPTEQSITKTLLFNENACLFMDAKAQKAGDGDVDVNSQNEDGDVQFKIQMARPENRWYRNLESGAVLENTEFFGRQFLISEEAQKLTWKISAEQKNILGFLCNKAVLQDTSREVAAWFAPSIPVPVGPGEFADLPGAVLEVVAMGGDRHIVATQVDFKVLAADAIEQPSKGKKVTRAEFRKIRDEKMKEMGAEESGNGMMRVIIRN